MTPNQKRLFSRLQQRLRILYGPEQVAENSRRLEDLLNLHLIRRQPETARWSERDTVLITYADIVQSATRSPLRTLNGFIKRRLKGAIGTVHLLPFYPWSSDGGFSVIDYRQVNEDYGSWDSIEALRTEAGVDLMFDLVLNHCSRESPWFHAFIAEETPEKDFFFTANPEGDWGQVVRPRVTPLFHEIETASGLQQVWTTFSADQVDLDWRNPEVLFEFLDIIMGYVERGARILRLDAVAFLWKEEGHSCVHHPKTHEMVKLIRDVLALAAPQVTLLTETNVAHHENISYFGLGDEAHMVYNFTLPPLLLYSLLRGDSTLLQQWVSSLPDLPPGCTYLNFTASHDGIGLRGLEGWVEGEDLDWLVSEAEKRGSLLGKRTLPGGKVAVYELNITYKNALSVEGDLELGARRFLCSQTVMLSLQGMPAVYFHSLVGSNNWTEGPQRDGGENRDINRERLDILELEEAVDDPETERGWILNVYCTILRIRRRTPAFSPEVPQRVIAGPGGVFMLAREPQDGEAPVMCLSNFTAEEQRVPRSLFADVFPEELPLENLLARFDDYRTGGEIVLRPYGTAWLVPEN